MIPKIIHYCWLSKDPYPLKIGKCIESWKQIIPNYEFILWDMNKCKEEKILSNWIKEAYDLKKYAFAADYIRLYAVYKYGGIYLDTDVEVIKPFDDLLHLPYFICREALGNRVEIAAFGAERNTEWINMCMEYYTNRHFILPNGLLNMKVIPDIIYETLSTRFTIKYITSIESFDGRADTFYLFPNDWFCANIYSEGKGLIYTISKNTFCIHHFANAWASKKKYKLPFRWIWKTYLIIKRAINQLKYNHQ